MAQLLGQSCVMYMRYLYVLTDNDTSGVKHAKDSNTGWPCIHTKVPCLDPALDRDYAQMLLEEGIRTHRDLHMKEILGSEQLESPSRQGASRSNLSSSYRRSVYGCQRS
jgi:hypothetical protein